MALRATAALAPCAPPRARRQRVLPPPARVGPQLRRVLTRAGGGGDDAGDRFVWKGGGDARGSAWEAAALEGRGGYATDSGLEWFFLDAGPPTARALRCAYCAVASWRS